MMTLHQLRPRSDIHLARKVWHCLGVLTIAYIFSRLDRAVAIQTMFVVTILMVLADYLRQKSETWNRWALMIMHPVMRDTERNGYAGSTALTTGTLLIMILFPPKVVLLSLLFLAIADPLASYFGIRYGKDRLFGNKSLQGSMAAFVACMIISMGYYITHGLMTERLLVVSILSGLAGAIAEVIPLRRLDDNFVMPVVSSGLLWTIFYLFGGFA